MANITRFDPRSDMVSLRSAMDRLFEDSFLSPGTWRTMSNGSGITPPVDVHETADEIVVSASLPGMKPEDVKITITGQNLTLRGEFKADDEVTKVKPRQIRINAGSGPAGETTNGTQAS